MSTLFIGNLKCKLNRDEDKRKTQIQHNLTFLPTSSLSFSLDLLSLNLTGECTNDELTSLFTGAGLPPTTASVVIGRNGRSRGYGLVTFSEASDALKAVETFNETEFQGRSLICHEDRGATKSSAAEGGAARPAREAKAPRAPRAPRAVDSAPDANFTGTSVFVNNLSWSTTSEDLKAAFTKSDSADVAIRNDGRSRGWGTVQFSSAEDAETAVQEMKGKDIGGRNVETSIDRKA
jgi:RNA recognition motif-containing protein